MIRPLNVLVGCEFSGCVRDAFIRAGHNAMSCDILPTESPGPHYQGNVFDVLGCGWDLAIFHPPCTYLSNSGVRWLYRGGVRKNGPDHERWNDMVAGAAFFKALYDAPIPHLVVENPRIHWYAQCLIGAGQFDSHQPWQFGHKETKEVRLWPRNLPSLIPTDIVGPPPTDPVEKRKWARVHNMPPGPERSKQRSLFFSGMADAMADQYPKWVYNRGGLG